MIKPDGTETYECIECSWQGPLHQLDAGVCPECGGEVEPLSQRYADQDLDLPGA